MSREQRFDPRGLDIKAFATAGATIGGDSPLAGFERLAGSLMATPGDLSAPPIAWSATGALRPVAGGAPEVRLHLQAQGRVTLQCQRCLQPLQQPLQVARWFRFAADEDEAARLDEDSEDDVLALSPRFDLHALVEDELILALPLVPLHEVCPQPLPMRAGDEAPEDDAPNPFAVLATLRRPPPAD